MNKLNKFNDSWKWIQKLMVTLKLKIVFQNSASEKALMVSQLLLSFSRIKKNCTFAYKEKKLNAKRKQHVKFNDYS